MTQFFESASAQQRFESWEALNRVGLVKHHADNSHLSYDDYCRQVYMGRQPTSSRMSDAARSGFINGLFRGPDLCLPSDEATGAIMH